MIRVLLTISLAISVFGGILASGQPATAGTVITGTVKSKDGKPVSGLALLEKGEIHNNVWDRGALVDPQGHFRIEVASGGQYGLHVYSSGYFYDPHAIKVETGKTLDVSITLVPEPTRANDPVIKKVGFFPWEARQGKVTYVKMEVADPNGILGPQVLALNAATGRVFALDPPSRVSSLKSNYPNGVYQLEVDTSQVPINPRDWHFVVADHQCNTTDILSYPHEPKPQQVIK
ncbi:MAG TPA: carboxypeptidase-like regulatory domain-containing protein [Candidatus Acidoferrum sp.]|nr:carboxypeptidase-like regulatory domain-containing protein [Candidatus Acidoferrum sp.]